MNELLNKLNSLSVDYNLSKFYCITLWPNTNQISLQGYYADANFEIARALDVKLELENDMLRGENEYYKITLTT